MPVKGLKKLLLRRSSNLTQILLWKISLTRAKGGTLTFKEQEEKRSWRRRKSKDRKRVCGGFSVMITVNQEFQK